MAMMGMMYVTDEVNTGSVSCTSLLKIIKATAVPSTPKTTMAPRDILA